MPNPPLTAPGWSSVEDALQSPSAFLQWISENLKVNRTVKMFHSPSGLLYPGMAAIVETDGKAYKYDVNDSTHQNKYVGIVERLDNGIVMVVTHGVLFNATLVWQQGYPYYISGNSYLTTIEPPDARFVAVGVDSNRILVMPSPSSGSSGGGGGIDEIDGGFANSVYLIDQNTDGGGA